MSASFWCSQPCTIETLDISSFLGVVTGQAFFPFPFRISISEGGLEDPSVETGLLNNQSHKIHPVQLPSRYYPDIDRRKKHVSACVLSLKQDRGR